MRRLVRVAISDCLLQEWITQGYSIGHPDKIVCEKGLPEGATLVNSYYDGQRGEAYLIYQHESFAEVPLAEKIPYFTPQFRRFYAEE
jgi:hypothetical protein